MWKTKFVFSTLFVLFLVWLLVASCADPTDSDGTGKDAGARDATIERVQVLVTDPPPDDEGGTGHVKGPNFRDAGYPAPNGIEYKGGPILLGSVGIYLIWYGDWSDTTKSLVADFVTNLSDSPYYKINTTYYMADGRRVSGLLDIRGQVDDPWSLGKDTIWSDTEQSAIAIISSQIAKQALPADEQSIFIVLVSKEQRTYDLVCFRWCAWHDRFQFDNVDMKIAVVWDLSRCPFGCSGFPDLEDAGWSGDAASLLTPNGDLAADSIVSALAHEIEETVTDPDINAWVNGRTLENADMCAWTWGDVYTTESGAPANMRLGSRDWLVQQNWVNADGGYCALSLP